MVSSGYVYCVGGAGSDASGVYYAPLSAGGVGTWTRTTSYPSFIFYQSCIASSGYVYCIGGGNSVYYASISSSGVGTWIPTTNYPMPVNMQSCIADSGYVYCVAGDRLGGNLVYYAPLSSAGVGVWISATNYPMNVQGLSCVSSSGYVYCIGGLSLNTINAVYYAAITPSSASPVPEFGLPTVLMASISMLVLAVLLRMRSTKFRPQSAP